MKIIVLQGGEDIKRKTNRKLLEDIVKISREKSIAVIPWTTDDPEKEKYYRGIIADYFRELGARKIYFIERRHEKEEIRMILDKADILYLPGGDPKILYSTIKEKGIEELIKEFNGIIIGNSAGAIVLSKGEVSNEINPGLGIVDFYVKVHFTLDEKSISSNEDNIVCIPENQWIIVLKK